MSSVINAEAQRHGVRQVIASSIGNAIEWYDWYTYSFLTVFFADQIFKSGSSIGSVLDAFAVFAVGFFLRPIGGLLLGSVADKWGRKNTLAITVLGIGLGSLIVAVTPTYASVGWLSPVILVFGRLVSGLSIGGEFASNTTWLVESAPQGRRGFFSSFQYVSTTIGQLIASGLAAGLALALTDTQMSAWGWRIPFFFGAVLALIALWIRAGASETREARQAARRPKLFDAIIHYPKASLMICGITLAGTITYYTWTTYLPTFAKQNSGIEPGKFLLISTIGLAYFTLINPVMGALSDKIGRRPMLLGVSGLFAIGIVPALSLVSHLTGFAPLLIVVLVGMTILAGFTSISAAVNAEQFPWHVRAAGVGFPYSLTVAIFGGTAGYVGTFMKKIDHPELFGWYIAILCAISFVVFLFLKETYRNKLDPAPTEATESAAAES